MWIVSERKSVILDSSDVARFEVQELRGAGELEPTGWQVVAIMRPERQLLGPVPEALAEAIPLAVFDTPETADDEIRELCDLLNGERPRAEWPAS